MPARIWKYILREGLRGIHRGFTAHQEQGWDHTNGDRWHSATGSSELSQGSSIFRVPWWVGELCQCSMFCDLHLASGNRNTKRKGRSVTDRQPLSQLIFDDLIDNKTNNFWGGCLCFAVVGMGRGSWDREDALSCLSICQALSQRSAREERVINRLEVISDVSVFLPCFQVIMFAGSRPPGSLPSY